MTYSEMLCSPLAERIVMTLTHFLWQGSAVAALVLVAGAVVGRDVRRRYLVSASGLLLLVIFPAVTFLLWNNRAVGVAQVVTTTDITSLDALATLESEAGYSAASADVSVGDRPLESLSPWLLAGWLIGVTTLSCRLMLGIISVACLKRSGEGAGESLRNRVRDLCLKLKLRTPALRVSKRVTQAMAVGFWRPVIILPAAWLAQLSPECVEAILAHELAHIRRRDLWVNLLQRVVETLLFYHPAVWWLSARLRHQREMCCDELAVSLTGRRVEYASTLELVARRRRSHVAPALAAGIGGNKMALLNRVRNILGLSPATSSVGSWTCATLGLLAAVGVCWIAWGGSPLTSLASAAEEGTLVALADGEEGNQEGRRDGDRKEGDRERPRDGDRPRGERDGDRPRGERDGDRPREGEARPDRPSPEQFRRHIEEMKAKVRRARRARATRRGPSVGERNSRRCGPL